ncbi:MAG: 6-bladed beta-propeller [bacterium]|nr:6-bladed beta-propeller [bacterium]
MKRIRLSILVSILLILSACSDETIDEVRNVHNVAPLWGDESKIELEFVQKIGKLEGEDDNYQFYCPINVVKDSKGNIYILELGGCRIQKFDSTGKYLLTIGSKGQGPGEFLGTLKFDIDDNDNIYLCDSQNWRLQIFSPEGKYEESYRWDRVPISFRVLNQNTIVAQFLGNKKIKSNYEIDPEAELIDFINKKGDILKSTGSLLVFGDIEYIVGNETLLDIDRLGNIYLTFRRKNRIEKYTKEGDLIFKMDRELSYEVNETIKTQTIPGTNMQITGPSFTSVSEGLGIDHKGRIWVAAFKKQKDGNEGESIKQIMNLEIYNSEGLLLGNISPPENFDKMRLFDDKLFFIDSWKNMCVYEYRIIEK